ncbi:MAG: EAL domain-containing protein [Methyloceanibacter sp.]|uniref:EAL domain-containing protein n=1 Tax=Methyloceanibacter sp. TaxID=1965321 RepID=UPI003D9BBD6F
MKRSHFSAGAEGEHAGAGYLTEDERISDPGHVQGIIQEYNRLGFLTALDDFGAGYAGLNLMANLPLDLIKIDMQLIRVVDRSHARQVIIAGLAAMARALDIAVIAEGVGTEGELQTLRAAGISLFQGYLFAKPEIERLPAVPMLLTDGVDRGNEPQRQTRL